MSVTTNDNECYNPEDDNLKILKWYMYCSSWNRKRFIHDEKLLTKSRRHTIRHNLIQWNKKYILNVTYVILPYLVEF